jgi:hypothetical protein
VCRLSFVFIHSFPSSAWERTVRSSASRNRVLVEAIQKPSRRQSDCNEISPAWRLFSHTPRFPRRTASGIFFRRERNNGITFGYRLAPD